MDDQGDKTNVITEQDLTGFKFLKKILPMLSRLHGQGCARDKAHNRTLHFDNYAALVLLYFFNPIVRSVGGIVQASELEKVQRELGVCPTSKASFSEAPAVFDPDLLEGMVKELAGQVNVLKHDGRLDEVPGTITIVDGTVIAALAKLVGQLGLGSDGQANQQIKLHTHFELFKGVSVDIDLTRATDSEVANLMGRLQPDRCYVKDRGYACFRLFQGIIDIGSHFVCRIRDNSGIHELIEDRPLSEEAKAAGILSDQVVRLGSDPKWKELKQPLRIIRIACKKHVKRIHTGRGGPEQNEFLLIATDLLDLPAEVIALIYQSRWTIEIFFRFFKRVLNCRHLLSHRKNGIEIQVYMAIISSLLIALLTGRKPTLRTVEMMQFYFSGWATEKELEAHIAKLKKQDE
jgi:Transposase DDE domain